VLVFAYDWSSFAEILNVNLHSIILWGGIGLVVTNVLLILFIYFRAVRPTVKVNDGVREYMKTKDSAAIAEKMNAIGQKNEIGRLADSISELAREIDRHTSDIARLTGEKERVEAELNLAAKIQLSALPATFPAFPEHDEFDLYASMTPAKNVGGDFYDFFFLDETHLGLVIADVSDKGVPAALFMMMAKILIKSCAMTEPSPAAVLARTNKNLCENNRNKMFVTVWFGVLDITTGHVTAANAGHEYPMIRKNGGGFEILKDSHDFVVGLRKNKEYHDYEFDLAPGDTLFLYTDGAAEAADSALQQFGTERMLAALNEAPDAGPEQLLGNMKAAIDRFVGDAPQFDDLTMLAIKIQKTGRKTP
jgi:serine phosphatase RsbU (regulator of sigma subunit)